MTWLQDFSLLYFPSRFALSWTQVVTLGLVVTAITIPFAFHAGPVLRFIWHCFIAPLGDKGDQRAALEKFYEGQAEVYDKTRNGLLRGRKTMLSLSAAHMQLMQKDLPEKKGLVWVDIGGGTGYNIEMMDQFMPISSFEAIYLVDLCEPLLQVARKRFATRGWTNVHVLCQDASTFTLPSWEEGANPQGSVDLVTLSYSLSMIPNFYNLLDRVDFVLRSSTGLVSVVDFYTSGRNPSLHSQSIGGEDKTCGWLSRWFWQIWFDLDAVHLGPARRDYLEYKFGTIKSYNGRNRFVLPLIVRIPYYIWLGRPRDCDTSQFTHAFEVEGGNTVGNCSPRSLASSSPVLANSIPTLEIGSPLLGSSTVSKPHAKETLIDIVPPLSSFHYQVKKEDPAEDMRHLRLTDRDSMFVITSAGDNALHYAIAAQPKRIHCVDMNPCQGHLLELKLAAIQSLPYTDFFGLFGEGKHPSFRQLLDSKIAPLISSACYQFWRVNSSSFDPSSSFYLNGYSGLALRLAQWVFWLAGVSGDVKRMCEAETLEEQEQIWSKKLKPVLLNGLLVRILNSPVFLWNALGVPINQRQMFLNEGTASNFIHDTLNPIPSQYLFKDGAYHYLLCLLGHYTPTSCPDYLTQRGFDILRADDGKVMDAFRLHTDSIINVLRGLDSRSITRAVIMDHLDWFSPGSKEVEEEVLELRRVLSGGGFVLLRSAARNPWYNEVFIKAGFRMDVLGMRKGPHRAIDRVNIELPFPFRSIQSWFFNTYLLRQLFLVPFCSLTFVMVGINDLPVEILCMILDYHRGDTKQLKQFSLISKPLLFVCRRYLFLGMRIMEPIPSINRSTRSWRRILKRSPYIRSYIRTMELGPPIFRLLAKHHEKYSQHWTEVLTSRTPSIDSDIMCQIMASVHGVEKVTLRFEFQSWDNYSSHFKETVALVVQRRSVTCLNLEDSVDFPLELLSSSSSLRELSLVSVNLSDQASSRDSSPTPVSISDPSEVEKGESAEAFGQRGRIESLLLFNSDDAVKQLVHLSRPSTGLDLSGLKRLSVNMTGVDGRNALKLIPTVARSIETLELRMGLNYSGLDLCSFDDFPTLKSLIISQSFNQSERHPIHKLLPFFFKTENTSKLEDLQLHYRCESPYANSCEMTQQDARRLIVSAEWRRLEACLLWNQHLDGSGSKFNGEPDTKYPLLRSVAVVLRPDDVAPFMTTNLEASLNVSLTGIVPRLHKATNIRVRINNDRFEKYL
ncbi:hypothetical protein CVT24_008964 [Panaeolus cyanescens]|uniref:Methyltransferase domain-containing protein n=1 Tax=Panaeolus cyanescens TaxID=181874 RepID=A0A409YAS4_9AGAR|nr:hypothetical protein CVT24_008964 [Panaeolus cyanescens]